MDFFFIGSILRTALDILGKGNLEGVPHLGISLSVIVAKVAIIYLVARFS